MRRCNGCAAGCSLLHFLSLSQASAQVDRIVIAAGTDEDHALQAITNEQDTQKKLTMYEDFVQKFSSNPAGRGIRKLADSQAYQATGDLQKSLDYGDKALAGLSAQSRHSGLADEHGQQAKNNAKLMDYAAKGGEVCHCDRQAD